jgi:hypothetical protein
MGNPHLGKTLSLPAACDVTNYLRAKCSIIDVSGWLHSGVVKHAKSLVIHHSSSALFKEICDRIDALLQVCKEVLVIFDGRRHMGKAVVDEQRTLSAAKREKMISALQTSLDDSFNGEISVNSPAEAKKLEQMCQQLASSIPRDVYEGLFKHLYSKSTLDEQWSGRVDIKIAPYEADHEIANAYRRYKMNGATVPVVIATDFDFTMHLCNMIMGFTFKNGVLRGKVVDVDDVVRAVPRADAKKHVQRLAELFEKHGKLVLVFFCLLTHTDYSDMKGLGPVAAVELLSAVEVMEYQYVYNVLAAHKKYSGLAGEFMVAAMNVFCGVVTSFDDNGEPSGWQHLDQKAANYFGAELLEAHLPSIDVVDGLQVDHRVAAAHWKYEYQLHRHTHDGYPDFTLPIANGLTESAIDMLNKEQMLVYCRECELGVHKLKRNEIRNLLKNAVRTGVKQLNRLRVEIKPGVIDQEEGKHATYVFLEHQACAEEEDRAESGQRSTARFRVPRLEDSKIVRGKDALAQKLPTLRDVAVDMLCPVSLKEKARIRMLTFTGDVDSRLEYVPLPQKRALFRGQLPVSMGPKNDGTVDEQLKMYVTLLVGVKDRKENIGNANGYVDSIIGSKCSCKAGIGHCWHKAALCFAWLSFPFDKSEWNVPVSTTTEVPAWRRPETLGEGLTKTAKGVRSAVHLYRGCARKKSEAKRVMKEKPPGHTRLEKSVLSKYLRPVDDGLRRAAREKLYLTLRTKDKKTGSERKCAAEVNTQNFPLGWETAIGSIGHQRPYEEGYYTRTGRSAQELGDNDLVKLMEFTKNSERDV